MNRKHYRQFVRVAVIMGAAVPAAALAQSAGADLLAINGDALRGELRMRYDAALAATNDPSVVTANDARYLWASEAKVQCGIAIGYMKSSTKDETSVRKCGDAHARFTRTQAPVPPPPPNQVCSSKLAGIVFFDFDSAIPPPEAVQTVDSVVHNSQTCGWGGLAVAGHADRSGSDAYNDALSMRRAEAVSSLLQSRGVSASMISLSAFGESEPRVPTADGVRELQNRRVEITVK